MAKFKWIPAPARITERIVWLVDHGFMPDYNADCDYGWFAREVVHGATLRYMLHILPCADGDCIGRITERSGRDLVPTLQWTAHGTEGLQSLVEHLCERVGIDFPDAASMRTRSRVKQVSCDRQLRLSGVKRNRQLAKG